MKAGDTVLAEVFFLPSVLDKPLDKAKTPSFVQQ